MSARIGNQSVFHAPRLTDPFDFAVEQGFDAFEWFPDSKADGAGWSEADLVPALRARIRESARARHMVLSVHASLQAGVMNSQGLELLRQDVQLASELGAAALILHRDRDVEVSRYAEALEPMARELASAGLVLAIENTPDAGPEQFNALFGCLAETVNREGPRVGMCFDLGHANLHETTHNDYVGYLDRLSLLVPIVHVHMHENYGDADAHLTVFTGPSRTDPSGIAGALERLEKRHFSGNIILEQWPEPPELLVQARQRLLQMMDGMGWRSGGSTAWTVASG